MTDFIILICNVLNNPFFEIAFPFFIFAPQKMKHYDSDPAERYSCQAIGPYISIPA